MKYVAMLAFVLMTQGVNLSVSSMAHFTTLVQSAQDMESTPSATSFESFDALTLLS